MFFGKSLEKKQHGVAACFLQVVMVNQSGVKRECEYGSTGQDQSLNKPLALYRVDEGHFLVVDYYQNRMHLLTNNFQFVRHLICWEPDGSKVSYPRNVCLGGGLLYVGTENGTISIHRVRTDGPTDARPNENENGWLLV